MSTFLNFFAGGPFSENLRESPVERRSRRSRRRRSRKPLSAAVHFIFFLIYNREIRQKKKSEIIYHASIWNWDLAWSSRIKEQSSSKNQCSLYLVLHPFQAWRVRSIQRLEFPLSLSLSVISSFFLFAFFFWVAENRGEENDAAGRSFLARFVVDI